MSQPRLAYDDDDDDDDDNDDVDDYKRDTGRDHLMSFLFLLLRYDIMMNCWQSEPATRPSFVDLTQQLKRMENQHKVRFCRKLWKQRTFPGFVYIVKWNKELKEIHFFLYNFLLDNINGT